MQNDAGLESVPRLSRGRWLAAPTFIPLRARYARSGKTPLPNVDIDFPSFREWIQDDWIDRLPSFLETLQFEISGSSDRPLDPSVKEACEESAR